MQVKAQTKRAELSEQKLKALEKFSSELQLKHEKLIVTEQEKSQALAELLQNDLT